MLKRKKRLKVFLGPVEIGKICGNISAALREMGYDTTAVVIQTQPYQEGIVYDRNLHFENKNKDQRRFSLIKLFFSVIFKYDAFIFLFGESLLPMNIDLPILKFFNKKTIMWFLGSDIRNTEAVQNFLKEKNIVFKQCELRQVKEKNIEVVKKLINRVEKNISFIITGISIGQLINIDYIGKDIKSKICVPVNIKSILYNNKANTVPVIVHAPTNDNFKGTSLINCAIEQLRKEGYKFEYFLFRKISNNEVLKKLSYADIAVDQLYAGGPGIFAIEAMAAGCAVLGGNIPEYSGAPDGSPIIHTTVNNIYLNIKRLLDNPELRIDLGFKGRQFVEENYSHYVVAEKIIKLLEI